MQGVISLPAFDIILAYDPTPYFTVGKLLSKDVLTTYQLVTCTYNREGYQTPAPSGIRCLG